MALSKLKTLVLFALVVVPTVRAQVSFTPREVAKPFTRGAGLCLVDLDQDGDLDIAAGSATSGVFWYENNGEKPAGWTAHTVDPSLSSCMTVATADFDRDGNPDLVAGSWNDDEVVWYRNDGHQNFTRSLIDGNLGTVHECSAFDIDLDGWPDVIAAGKKTGEVAYYRNREGNGWTRQTIATGFAGARSVTATDIDDDGDIDLAGAALDDNEAAIWRNDGGSPVIWTKISLTTGLRGAHFVQFTDINRDGRPDLVVAAYSAGIIAWWENTGTDVSGWVQHNVETQLTGVLVSRAADIDLDGDMDIVASGSTSNNIVFYENTGNGSSWRKTVIDPAITGPWPVVAGDIDGDLDIDIVTGADQGNEIRWYENRQKGRFTGSVNLPGGAIRCGVFTPLPFEDGGSNEILIAVHGGGHPTMYAVLRDGLIPVSEERYTAILTPDFPLAEGPDYIFSNRDDLRELIRYAIRNLSADSTRIYLLGLGCQGRGILETGADPTVVKKGIIAVNPALPAFDPAGWTSAQEPLAIFSCLSNPFNPNIQNLIDLYGEKKLQSKMTIIDGSPNDLLVDEIAGYTLEGMAFIDSCGLISSVRDPVFGRGGGYTATLCRENSGNTLLLNGYQGEDITITRFDLAGRAVATLYRGRVDSDPFRIGLPQSKNPVSGSIGLIRISGEKDCRMVKVFD
jgi:hypothetical protein